MNMKTAAQALEILISQAKATQLSEKVVLQEALGRVLAKDVISSVNVPPMNNTQMDGYVLRAEDIKESGTILPVTQRIPAGHLGNPLDQNTAARIFTGASIPQGATAVVMQEDCEVIGTPDASGLNYQIKVNHVPKVGEWIREKGEDIRENTVILHAGTYLRPQELGVAASSGMTHLEVKQRIKVALFFTGDELTLPGQPLKPGGIYNSNRDTLIACVKALGCDYTDFGIVPDTLVATRKTLRAAAEHHDLIVTSGGVSVGEEDHIKPAVQAEGQLDMWQIAIKPGKPLAFGTIKRDQTDPSWFMGLPGNPVSSFVTFLLFVKPFIRALQGAQAKDETRYELESDFDWVKPDKRNEFLRVKINSAGKLELYPNQSSGVLTSAVWADGLADVPAGQAIRKGDKVSFIPFSQLLGY
jgi:molybdopterin molybdotransferase